MLPMISHLFSSGSYRSIVFPISEPIQPPTERPTGTIKNEQCWLALSLNLEMKCDWNQPKLIQQINHIISWINMDQHQATICEIYQEHTKPHSRGTHQLHNEGSSGMLQQPTVWSLGHISLCSQRSSSPSLLLKPKNLFVYVYRYYPEN